MMEHAQPGYDPDDAPAPVSLLVTEGDGMAVVGEPTSVEAFLRSLGLWSRSENLDLTRLTPKLGAAAGAVQAASGIAAGSSRWLKLTPESADVVKKFGLMETQTPGVSHAMVGKPGSIQSWIQVEQGAGSLLDNPALLSGAAGIMAQLATQQTMAEITEYLARIDQKVDDVLSNQKDAVVANTIGAGLVIDDAMTVREATGQVNEVTWGKVQGLAETIGYTQGYALLQLRSLAEQLEGQSKVRDLAKTTGQAQTEVQDWLAVLARCTQLQGALDVLELDRVLDVSPQTLDGHRRGLRLARENRLDLISRHTEELLDRIDTAVGTANEKLFWNRSKSPAVVHAGNHVATGIDDFHGLLGITSEPRTWEVRQLEGAAEKGSQAIQVTKDTVPVVAAAAGLLAVAAVVADKAKDSEAAESGQ